MGRGIFIQQNKNRKQKTKSKSEAEKTIESLSRWHARTHSDVPNMGVVTITVKGRISFYCFFE